MNEKRLNITCYAVIVMFFIYSIFYVIFSCVELKREQQKVDALYDYALSVNQRVEKENLIFKNDNVTNEKVELLYTEETKVKAIVEGYNKTLNSSSFIADVTGDLNLDLPIGLSAKVKMSNFAVKYSAKKAYVETGNYITEAPSLIAGILKSRSQFGKKQILDNDTLQCMKTYNVTMNNNEIFADYSGCSYGLDDELCILENLYEINEETIKEVTYFKTKMKNGKPVAYYISAQLEPMKSTEKYRKYVECSVKSPTTFKSVKITVVLNEKGEMIAATSVDEFTAKSEGFEFTATLTNSYAISCIGEENLKEYS